MWVVGGGNIVRGLDLKSNYINSVGSLRLRPGGTKEAATGGLSMVIFNKRTFVLTFQFDPRGEVSKFTYAFPKKSRMKFTRFL